MLMFHTVSTQHTQLKFIPFKDNVPKITIYPLPDFNVFSVFAFRFLNVFNDFNARPQNEMQNYTFIHLAAA